MLVRIFFFQMRDADVWTVTVIIVENVSWRSKLRRPFAFPQWKGVDSYFPCTFSQIVDEIRISSLDRRAALEERNLWFHSNCKRLTVDKNITRVFLFVVRWNLGICCYIGNYGGRSFNKGRFGRRWKKRLIKVFMSRLFDKKKREKLLIADRIV